MRTAILLLTATVTGLWAKPAATIKCTLESRFGNHEAIYELDDVPPAHNGLRSQIDGTYQVKVGGGKTTFGGKFSVLDVRMDKPAQGNKTGVAPVGVNALSQDDIPYLQLYFSGPVNTLAGFAPGKKSEGTYVWSYLGFDNAKGEMSAFTWDAGKAICQ